MLKTLKNGDIRTQFERAHEVQMEYIKNKTRFDQILKCTKSQESQSYFKKLKSWNKPSDKHPTISNTQEMKVVEKGEYFASKYHLYPDKFLIKLNLK